MTTFYRKYRPKKIAELDLGSVRDLLLTSLKSGKLAHAYLFVGPRGSGKTSAARILAKAVNCEKAKGAGEPCLKCNQCKSVEAGSAVDVVEIDAASHRGIDAMRELRDKIGLSPVAGGKKVYIIDEVHMLTTEAFNALLKTLEEPPEHAMFFLCTTEAHKVPETIVSRCVKVSFTKATAKEVGQSLSKAVKGEGLEMEKGAIEILADSMDGSFREGHKLLEQLVGGGEKITVDKVREILGQVKGVDPAELAKLMLVGNAKEALVFLAEAEKKGVDWAYFGEQVLNYLRGQLRAKYGLGEVEVSESVERVKLMTERVAAACVEMKSAVVVVLPLELVAVEMGIENGNGDRPMHRATEQQGKVEEKIEVKESGVVEEKVTKIEPEVEESKKLVKKEAKNEDVGNVGDKEFVGNVSLDQVLQSWEGIISTLAPQNHSVAGLLRSCKPKAVEDKFLVIEAYYKFHKEQLEQESRRQMVEEALKSKVGLPAVRFVLGQKAAKVVEKMPEHDNIAVAGDDKLVEAVEDVFGVEV